MEYDNLSVAFRSLSLGDVRTRVTFTGVYKHIPRDRVRVLDRIVRFQPYGYTTTSEPPPKSSR